MGVTHHILNTREKVYTSQLDTPDLKDKIKDLQPQGSTDLVGELVGENGFAVYDPTVVIGWSMPYLKRRSAYVSGKITTTERGLQITLKVQPNSLLPIVALLAVVLGSVLLLMAATTAVSQQLLLVLGCLLLGTGIMYHFLGTILRDRLKKKLVRYLGLSEDDGPKEL